jgi:hypothetical protein
VKHKRIAAAAEIANVVVLCCHQRRPGLDEIDVERGVLDVLRAAGWAAWPVIAEVTGRRRRAPAGTLDLVAWEPGGSSWWIECKRGDRDLTDEQLRVMITDEASLVAEWIGRKQAKFSLDGEWHYR